MGKETRKTIKWWQKLSDFLTCYLMAWFLIAFSPIWLPVWLAVKIYNIPEERGWCEVRELIRDNSFRAGVKAVVDSLDWHGTSYQTHEGSPIIELQVSEDWWQAKLKEWGVEEDGN